MPWNTSFKLPADNVAEIVDKTKILADRLRLAIIHQDNLTQDCFDTTATELSIALESIKNRYAKLDEELQAVKEEVRVGEVRVNNIKEEYDEVLRENACLKETVDGILSQETVFDEQSKIAQELKAKLKMYKLLTGVRFDFGTPENILSGYVGIKGSKPSNSTLIPFEINKDNSNVKQILLDKISEACLEISE